MTYYCVLHTETGDRLCLGSDLDEATQLSVPGTALGQGETKEIAQERAERLRRNQLCRCAQGCCE